MFMPRKMTFNIYIIKANQYKINWMLVPLCPPTPALTRCPHLTEAVSVSVFHADVRPSQPSHLSSVRPAVPRPCQVPGYLHQQGQQVDTGHIAILLYIILQPNTNGWSGGHPRRSLRSEPAQVSPEVFQVQGAAVLSPGILGPVTMRCYPVSQSAFLTSNIISVSA